MRDRSGSEPPFRMRLGAASSSACCDWRNDPWSSCAIRIGTGRIIRWHRLRPRPDNPSTAWLGANSVGAWPQWRRPSGEDHVSGMCSTGSSPTFVAAGVRRSSFAEGRGSAKPRCSGIAPARPLSAESRQIAGFESEFELPFAALHQLCAPMLRMRNELPEPQAHALQVAFGLRTGGAPDRFVVGLAALSLLAEAANEEPLVCLIDDAQWLDEASCHALEFVGRRLLAESVLLILAVREVGQDRLFAGLPVLALEGLANEDASRVARRRRPRSPR